MNPHIRGALILLGVTAIWGSTFAVVKVLGAGNLSPALIIAWRFSIGLLALLPALWWLGRRTPAAARFTPQLWRDGAILGGWLMAGYATQTVALQTTTANRAAFFTALSVVLVPLWLAGVQRRPLPWTLWLALPLAVGGLGLLSWEGGAWVAGDGWALACAVTYAGFIISMEGKAGQHSPLPFTVAQVAFVTVAAWLWAVWEWVGSGASEGALLPNGDLWGALLYLGILATGLTTLLQTVGQRSVSAAEASLIYALEPVTASLFSYVLIAERIGLRGMLGGLLVVMSTVLSSVGQGAAHTETPAPAAPERLG